VIVNLPVFWVGIVQKWL